MGAHTGRPAAGVDSRRGSRWVEDNNLAQLALAKFAPLAYLDTNTP